MTLVNALNIFLNICIYSFRKILYGYEDQLSSDYIDNLLLNVLNHLKRDGYIMYNPKW
jgi:hypothetical protein